MSIFKAPALLRIFGQQSRFPIPTENDLKGYQHISRANEHLLFLRSDVNASIFPPLLESLKAINSPKSLELARHFDNGRYVSSTQNLYVFSSEPGLLALRKSTIADLRDFCLGHLRHDTPVDIKANFHEFLIKFPPVLLHEDFRRPVPARQASGALALKLA